MSPSTPQHSGPTPDANGPADAPRNPLGFADVRAAELPASAPSGAGTPLGFAPRAAVEPVFETEVSFRRDRWSHVALRAEAFHGGDPRRLQVGHAEAHEVDPVVSDTTAETEAAGASDEVRYDEPAAEERVPFLKREIGFGRKKETVEAVAPEDGDVVPFYKREITFGRKKEMAADDVPSPAEQSPEEAVPFFKRELSFKRRKPAAVPAELAAAEPVEEAVEPAATPHLYAVEDGAPETTDIETADDLSFDAPAAEQAVDEAPVAPQSIVEEDDVVFVDEPSEGSAALEEPEAFSAADEAPTVEQTVEQPYDEPYEQTVEELVVVDEARDVTPVEDDPVSEASVEDARADEPAAVLPSEPGREPKARKARKPKGGGKSKGRVVGLKIGASQVAAAVVQENAGRHELLQLARRPIEPGLVVDGEVRDAARLAEVLRTFVEEHDLPRSNVRIGLASNRIGVRTVEITGIDDPERFDNAVRFKAHEVLPVAFHESVLDYRVVEERPIENGDTSKRVLLVVAPRDQVEPYVTACAQAGIRLAGIDLEALGLLRTFVDPHPIGFRAGDDTATVVVSLGHESTTLLVAGGGVCDFTRVFDWGGETLQTAIAGELDVDPDEASRILRHLSLGGRGRELESLLDEARTRANQAIRSRLTPFARELVSSLQFYQTQPDSLGIGEIVITGGTAHLGGLAEALHQMIGVSVRFGDPLGRIVSRADIPDALHARIGSMAVPIGLAIEDTPWRTVNLLPKELRQQGRKRPNVLAIAAPAVAVASVAALALGFVSAHGTASDRREELDAVQAQIDALPEPSRPTIDPALQSDQVARAQSVALVLGGRLAWEPFFRDLSRALPRNVWLERVSATAPDPATIAQIAVAAPAATVSALPTGVTINGYTYSQSDVALLLARLQAIPSIRNVTLQNARKEQKGTEGSQVDVVSFSILADLNGGAQ